jgi:hypothetical protein
MGSIGGRYIAEFIRKSETLEWIDINECSLDTVSMQQIHGSLKASTSVIRIDCASNPISRLVDAQTNAEVEANQLLKKLIVDPLSVDVNELSIMTQEAFIAKLHTLPRDTLEGLFENPSFGEPLTAPHDTLHLLAPRNRTELVKMQKEKDPGIIARIERVKHVERHIEASKKIFHAVIVWYRRMQRIRLIELALAQSAAKAALADAYASSDESLTRYSTISVDHTLNSVSPRLPAIQP